MTLREQAIDLRDKGLSVRQIAAQLAQPLATVGDWIATERRTVPYARGGRHSYRLAGVAQPKGGLPSTYKITVPARIGNLVPPDMEFVPELTEDGILFRVVAPESEPERPSWLT